MDRSAPDGISQANLERFPGRANPLPLLVLTALLGAAMAGLLGGLPAEVRRADGDAAGLSVRMPEILRNGTSFETIVEVRPRRAVGNLVIGVSDGLWAEMTINTMIPAAGRESFADGFHRFSFGKVEAGETFRFKIDGQVNPPVFGGTSGEIAAFDGERRLAAVPVRMKVLP